MLGKLGAVLVVVLHVVVVSRATETGVHMLDDGAAGEAVASPSWIASGTIEMSTSGGTLAAAGWVHVKEPVRFKWSTENECFSFQAEGKVDAMLCKDDPEGEAVWVVADNQLRQWGDQGICLATEDGTEEVQLKECGTVSEQDGWSTPEIGGVYNEIKSLKQDLCLVPVDGSGPRSVKLGACGEDATHWKADNVDGKAGTCAIRWPTDSEGLDDQSGLPAHRSCFHSTGHNMGTWHDDVVFGDLGAPTAQGRLQNHAMLDAPSTAENVAQCAAQCADKAGCRGFNFSPDQLLCELVKQSRADADPADFDQSAEASEWSFYEPQTITPGTSCTAGCLPATTTRLQFPSQSGGKFVDSAPDGLPTAAATKFDATVFSTSETVGEDEAECMAEADGVTVEVTSYCEVAKAVRCKPDSTDLTKEACDETKESHCRRMVLVPITTFSDQKAQFREQCGHGAQEATKLWNAARISLEHCSSVVGFNQHCGSIQANY
jgi:hypothetical protein